MSFRRGAYRLTLRPLRFEFLQIVGVVSRTDTVATQADIDKPNLACLTQVAQGAFGNA
ncbi:conserved hypothetical protein [Ahrensia sp. R2A130]|nr:conserved hypothetical protein [Ahrensia sp. R2A130]